MWGKLEILQKLKLGIRNVPREVTKNTQEHSREGSIGANFCRMSKSSLPRGEEKWAPGQATRALKGRTSSTHEMFRKVLLRVVESGLWESLWELDINKARCSSVVFPKICRLRLAQPQPQKRKMQNTASPKLFTFREAGMQVSPVTM
jgi:hypothetical protein